MPGEHEVDFFRGDSLGRTDIIPFVLAIFIVENNDDLAIEIRIVLDLK